MSTIATDMETMRQAIEGRDADTLVGLYADDAEMRVVDRLHPPSTPLELHGKAAIAGYFTDICGRAMTHRVSDEVNGEGRWAFTQACAYPDGTKVLCATVCELQGGKIARQTTVQAWDE